MYNEYLQQAAPDEFSEPMREQQHPPPVCLPARAHAAADRSAGRAKLDADTLVAIAVIWFLLSDGKALDTDLLIIIGVLLLLGI